MKITIHESYIKESGSNVSKDLLDKLDNMFHYHNKNLNKYQYGVIDDLWNALSSNDSNKIKASMDALDNLVHYKNKGLNNSQYALLDELLTELKSKYESKQGEAVHYNHPMDNYSGIYVRKDGTVELWVDGECRELYSGLSEYIEIARADLDEPILMDVER